MDGCMSLKHLKLVIEFFVRLHYAYHVQLLLLMSVNYSLTVLPFQAHTQMCWTCTCFLPCHTGIVQASNAKIHGVQSMCNIATIRSHHQSHCTAFVSLKKSSLLIYPYLILRPPNQHPIWHTIHRFFAYKNLVKTPGSLDTRGPRLLRTELVANIRL